jgi:hypothetical protein
MDGIATPSSLSSVNPSAYSGIDTSKTGVDPPGRSASTFLTDILSDPLAETYKKYPGNVLSSGPSRPPPDGEGYETVYVLKGAIPLTLAGKPILFPSPVYIGREYEDGIHMVETPEMSIMVFVPNHWDDSEDEE